MKMPTISTEVIQGFPAACRELGVDGATAGRAARRLIDGEVMLLVLSGKLTAGKDTVAPELLERVGVGRRTHCSYAAALRGEVDDVLSVMRAACKAHDGEVDSAFRATLGKGLEGLFDLPVDAGGVFTGDLLDVVAAGGDVTSRTRSPVMRTVLQQYGTDIRRRQDDDYWVKRALATAVAELADGASVYFTDARFPNEVAFASRLCGVAVRLDVSRDVQLARLAARDGIADPDPSVFLHASEVSLDDYDSFDARVDSSGPVGDTVAQIEKVLEPDLVAA